MHCIEMQPLNCPNWREIKFWPAVVLLVVALTNPVRGCLRATIDERAVQWASAIVEAKLAQAGDTVDLGLTPAQSYRIYIFEVLDVLDGPAKSRDKIDVLRLIGQVRRRKRDGVAEQHRQDLRKRRSLRIRGAWHEQRGKEEEARHARDSITNSAVTGNEWRISRRLAKVEPLPVVMRSAIADRRPAAVLDR